MFWLAGVLALTGVIHMAHRSRLSGGRDFYQVWLPARVYAEPAIHDLYSVTDRKSLGQYVMSTTQNPDISSTLRNAIIYSDQTYPHHFAANFTPTMLMVYAPFVSVDYDANLRAFSFISLTMYLLGLVLLARVAGLSDTGVLWVVAAGLWWFLPVGNDTIDGNVNRLQLGIVGLSVWLSCHKRYMLAAIFIGALVMFKPNLVLLPGLMLVSPISCKQWRRCVMQAGGNILGMGAGFIAPVIMFGDNASWSNWFSHVQQLHQKSYAIEDGNIATARLILESTGLNVSILLTLVLSILTIGVIAMAAKRGRDTGLFAAGMAALIAIVCSQLAWPHYPLLLAPLLITVFQVSMSRTKLMIVLWVIYLIIAERILRNALPWMTNMQYGYLLGAAMLVLAAIAAKDLMRPAPAR
jgi:hypothetical protein